MSQLAKATITLVDKIPARRRRRRTTPPTPPPGGQAATGNNATTPPAPAPQQPPQPPTRYDDLETIALHFNPESLDFKIDNKTDTKKKRTNQRVQYTGASSATLSFECIFDSTRPGTLAAAAPPDGAAAGPEALDVRAQTRILSGLLNGLDPDASSEQQLYPKLVRFEWGTIQFQGYVTSFSETLDFFSPEGVPLRSKVSITLTEQSHRYHVTGQAQRESAAQAARREGATRVRPTRSPATGELVPSQEPVENALADVGATLNQVKDVARQSNLPTLFAVSEGAALSYLPSIPPLTNPLTGADRLTRSKLDAPVNASAKELSGVFEHAGGTDQGSAWAPAGPAAGTESAALAAEVLRQRKAQDQAIPVGGTCLADQGGDPAFTDVPTPVVGSPPTRRTVRPSDREDWAPDRPLWEGLPSPASAGGCGCSPCTSGCCS